MLQFCTRTVCVYLARVYGIVVSTVYEIIIHARICKSAVVS
jgi:hypothetical protein